MTMCSKYFDISKVFNTASNIMLETTKERYYRYNLYKYIETIDSVKDMIIVFKISSGHEEIDLDTPQTFSIDLEIEPPIKGQGASVFNIGEEPEITRQILEESLTKMFEILERVRFDKFTGNFYDSIKENNSKYIIENLQKCQNIKMRCAECCVCYEMTQTRTNCNHNICISCYSNLKTEDEDCDCECTFCPICWEEIHRIL